MSRIVPNCRRRQAAIAALLAVLCLSGCGSSNRAARYIPDANAARQALEAAMIAWQQDEGTSLSLDGQAIEVIDKHRRPGQTLSKFNILGEVSGDGGRWFEVELHFVQPAQTEQVRYVVVGINPLWIFRQQDYELLGHWDHPMPSNIPASTTPSVASEAEAPNANRDSL
jgi:hypothetical protein